MAMKGLHMSENTDQTACQQPLPQAAVRGLQHFNTGEYFEAHEFLEAAWQAERGPVRELYRGVLQVAVAYYHIQRGNPAGALKLFARLRKWLAPFGPVCQGIDLSRLLEDVDIVEAELRRLSPARVAALDSSFFHPVTYQTKHEG
jgi:predicted metal-dependent hydrolase